MNDFHPDRYFGKSLGSFKPKLERLFTRVTEAHDVLTRVSAREDYDRYLTTVRHTRARSIARSPIAAGTLGKSNG